MFERRALSDRVARVRDAYAPDAIVVDVDRDFDTLPPEAAEELGLLVDRLAPATYPLDWLPENAPTPLRRYAGTDLTIGMPADGTVVWTRQTEPPVVLVKQRAAGTPDDFLAFLLAAAFVELAADVPEQFFPFFENRYRELAAVPGLAPADCYQLAAALFDAWVGLETVDEFASWGDQTADSGETDAADDTRETSDASGDGASDVSNESTMSDTDARFPELFAAWVDAGERLEPRLDRLSAEMARGETTFPAATEYACSAVRHGIALPAPFSALNTAAYREHGAEFGLEWARKTLTQLEE